MAEHGPGALRALEQAIDLQKLLIENLQMRGKPTAFEQSRLADMIASLEQLLQRTTGGDAASG